MTVALISSGVLLAGVPEADAGTEVKNPGEVDSENYEAYKRAVEYRVAGTPL